MNQSKILDAIAAMERVAKLLREALEEPPPNERGPDLEFLDTDLQSLDLGKGHTKRARDMFKHFWFLDGNKSGTRQMHTVRDLVGVTEIELNRQPNIGPATIRRLKGVLEDHGLYLRDGV